MVNNEDLKHLEEVLDDAYCSKLLEESRNDPESHDFSSFDDFVRKSREMASRIKEARETPIETSDDFEW